jgi:hypothetical protein
VGAGELTAPRLLRVDPCRGSPSTPPGKPQGLLLCVSAVREFAPVSHRLPPTGTDSRRRRSGHALSDAPRTPPPPPKGLSASERAAWRELWSSPVAALWTSDDVPSVVRLIRLRARLDAEGVAAAPVSLFGQVARLEDRLILTPQARRQAGIVLADDPRRAGSGRNASRPPSARERERLLRG